jgi:hypothetical protein
VANPEQLRDCVARGLHVGAVGHAHADRADAGPADEVLAHDAEGHQHLVVRVGEAGATLGLQDPDDLERDAADRHVAADGLGAEAEVGRHRGTEDDLP